MVLIDASLVYFGVIAKFPRQKFDSILSFFRGGNPTALHLRCVIAHKTLFSPSFRYENMATKVPHFHYENSAEFQVWCVMAHRQSYVPVYTVRAVCSY